MSFSFMGLHVISSLVKTVTAPVCFYTATGERCGISRIDSPPGFIQQVSQLHFGGVEVGGGGMALHFSGSVPLWGLPALHRSIFLCWQGDCTDVRNKDRAACTWYPSHLPFPGTDFSHSRHSTKTVNSVSSVPSRANMKIVGQVVRVVISNQ